jgi:hypothetical protein
VITDPDGAAISLTFTTFDVEDYWDTLELYNAPSSGDALNMFAYLNGDQLSDGPLTKTSGGHHDVSLHGVGTSHVARPLPAPTVLSRTTAL